MSEIEFGTTQSPEIKLFDINFPQQFKSWWEWMTVYLGQKDFSADMEASYRRGHLDEEAMLWKLPADIYYVSPGCTYRGERHVEGLTGQQYSTRYPASIASAAIATLREKLRHDFVVRAGRCINCMLGHMTENTRRFFLSIEQGKKAVDDRDLVFFAYLVRTRGQIGTGDIDEAARTLELLIDNQDPTTMLWNTTTNVCDLSLHCMNWKYYRETLKELGSHRNEKMMVKSFINSLPPQATVIKAMVSTTTGMPATLDDATKYFCDMVVNLRYPLNDCGPMFNVLPIKNKTKLTARGDPTHNEKDETGKKRERTADHDDNHGVGDIGQMVAALQTSVAALANDFASAKGTFRNSKKKNTTEENSKKTSKSTECRNFINNGTCEWEKQKGSACKFTHSGSVAKIDGVIKPVKIISQKK